MNKLIIIQILLFAALNSVAQQITFNEKEFNFGKIDELGGAVSHRFEYTNTGDKPLILTKVQTTCGCTSPSWSKEPIAPQKTGYIDVTFDPRDRVGMFSKSIIVSSNSQENNVFTLYIDGEVTARPKPISEEYPYTMFDLRLKNTTVNFNRVLYNSTVQQYISVYNPTKANIKIEKDPANTPDYITITPKPSILKPGEKGLIKCEFNAQKYNQFDYIQFTVPILVNTYSYKLTFKAFITEEFSDKERQNAPELTLTSEQNPDLGKLKQGETATHVIKFTNTGKSTLKIRAIRNASKNVTYKILTPEVEPGKTGEIQISVDTNGHQGYQNRYITIITNSPKNQNVIVKISLYVEEHI